MGVEMKALFRRLWVRFLIKQLKKGAVNSETATRILIHYTLLEMQKKQSKEIEIEYEAPDITDVKLIIIGYLTDKN